MNIIENYLDGKSYNINHFNIYIDYQFVAVYVLIRTFN